MKLNPIFSDHAVFAANKKIPIFGSGRGRATVRLGEFSVDIRSDADTLSARCFYSRDNPICPAL